MHSESFFDGLKSRWNNSRSCSLLKIHLHEVLDCSKVTKIICFGLGDICRRPPEWMMRKPTDLDEHNTEGSFLQASMIQHLIALTMAETCFEGKFHETRLLAQDPDYTPEARRILDKNGFSIVGEHGAGGFAEIDDSTIVYSVFVEAPLKQIVADIARPILFLSTAFGTFNDAE